MKTAKLFLMTCVLAASTSPIRAELVGHWKFDGDLQDNSGKENHGSLEGSAALGDDTSAALGSGQSLQLDGSGYVLVEHSESLNLEETLTLTAWIKPVGNTGWDGILAKNPSAESLPNHAGNYEWRIHAGNRRLEFLTQQGDVNDTLPLSSTDDAFIIEEGQWTHVAVSVDAKETGAVKFYVNGELTADDFIIENTFLPTNENPLYIGNRADLTTTPFNGFLDDVRIYNTVLSDEEIANIAAGTASSLSAGRFSSAVTEGTTIARLSYNTPEEGESYTFALINGEGDNDNEKFAIEGNALKTGGHNFAGDPDGTVYSIRVQTTAQTAGDRFTDIFNLILTGDSDSDDLPDAFEKRFTEDLARLSGQNNADADQDGLSDLQEFEHINGEFPDLNPTNPDTDGDTLLDGEEIAGAGQRPPTNPTLTDTDGDGLNDKAENNTGTFAGASQTGTNPTLIDTDGDGAADGKEVAKGSNPTNAESLPPVLLIGLWRFDEGDARDDSGREHDGQAFDLVFPDQDPVTPGQGKYADFDSTGGGQPRIEIPHHQDFNLDDELSIAAWVFPIDNVVWDGILAKNPSAESAPNHAGNFELRIQSGGRALQFLSQRGGINDTATYTSAETVIQANEWSHIAVTAKAGSGNLQFFLNGELSETLTEAINFDAFPVNENPLYIGSRADLATPFDGFLDDVALFDGVLSESQVQAVMNGDFDGFSAEEPQTPQPFSITEVAFHPEAESVTISWESVSGASYTVETSSDLVTWTPLAEEITPGAGNSTSYTDNERAPDAEILFYRVIQH